MNAATTPNKPAQPTAHDRLVAAKWLRELGGLSNAGAPEPEIYEHAAQLVMKHRNSVTLATHVTYKLRRDLERKLRTAALHVVIAAHVSAGHPIPAHFAVPAESLPDLLTKLEDVLFSEIEITKPKEKKV